MEGVGGEEESNAWGVTNAESNAIKDASETTSGGPLAALFCPCKLKFGRPIWTAGDERFSHIFLACAGGEGLVPDTLAIDEDNVVHITIDEDKLLESSDETWEVERSTEIPPRKKISLWICYIL